MSLKLKTFVLAICCSIISHYSFIYGQQPSSNPVDYDAEFNKICQQLSSDPYNAELYSKLKVLLGKLPDMNEQCRCAAIYCLAVSVAGNSAEASKAIGFIEKKNPNSEYLQRLSGNNLSVNCPNCNGKGTITSQCKTCGGSGQCSMCKGRGSLEGIGGKTRSCSCGTGKCKQCAGTGNATLKCQKCGGRGKIIDQAKIKEIYIALLNENAATGDQDKVKTQHDENIRRDTINKLDTGKKALAKQENAKNNPQGKTDPSLVKIIAGYEKTLWSSDTYDSLKLSTIQMKGYISNGQGMELSGASEYKAKMTSLSEQADKCIQMLEKENVKIAFDCAEHRGGFGLEDDIKYKGELEAIKDANEMLGLKPVIDRKIQWYSDRIAKLERGAAERAAKDKKELAERKVEEEKSKAAEEIIDKRNKEYYDKYKNKSADQVDIKKVLLEPKKYKGQVLSSMVSIGNAGIGLFYPPLSEEHREIWLKVPKEMKEKCNNATDLIMIKYFWYGEAEEYGYVNKSGSYTMQGVLLDISIP